MGGQGSELEGHWLHGEKRPHPFCITTTEHDLSIGLKKEEGEEETMMMIKMKTKEMVIRGGRRKERREGRSLNA